MADSNAIFRALTTTDGVRLPLGGDGHLAPDLRVLAGMATLLTLLIVAVLGAVLLIDGLDDDAAHLTDSQIQYATAINAAALTAKAMANDERGFLLSGNPRFIRQLDDRTGRARASFSVAANEADSRAQRRAVAEAYAGFERWVHALQRETASFQAGNHEQAVANSLGPVRDLRKRYEVSLGRAQALGADAIQSVSQSARSSASDASSRSIRILLAYLGVALVVGLAVTVWVVRTILRPVRILLHHAAAGERVNIVQ